MMKKQILAVSTFFLSMGAYAQPGVIPSQGVRSMNDGEHYTAQGRDCVIKYRYSDGTVVDTLFSGPSRTSEPRKSWMQGYSLSADESRILLTTDREPVYRHSSKADYWIYDIPSKSLRRLSESGKQQEATFSPDGTKVAFVRENNLFLTDIEKGTETRLTSDGKWGEVINGLPDWVYEEEYSFSRAFEWAPDSKSLAFYRFDESRVKEYSMNMFEGKLYPANYNFKYPKAGEENSVVQLKVYRVDENRMVDVRLDKDPNSYIPRIEWAGNRLAVHWVNRLQNEYEVWLADAMDGSTSRLYRETDPRYIERIGYETMTFLPENKGFVVKSERDGWMHLYRYDMQGRLVNRVTQGNWEVTAIYGVDAKNGKVYYQSTERGPLGRDVYEVGLNGKGKRQLSETEPGTQSATFSKTFKYYINTFTNTTTPGRRILAETRTKKIIRRQDTPQTMEVKPVKEFFTFTTSQGVELNGWMIKPQQFDSSQQYPVFMTQYSGPGSQQVANRWGSSWEQNLSFAGYIIVCVDGRGTGYRGAEFKKCTYGDLGRLEVEDQIEAAKYLGTLDYVDAARIGIYGWSYGGFMALNCILKGADVFKLAIAVAPVTSWRYYDTIYTEIYNGLPQDNPKGYDENSPINYADRLKGKLLIAHGTADDNVHIQNTYEMIEALVKAEKDFKMLIYPDKNHGMGSSRNHLTREMMDFVVNNL